VNKLNILLPLYNDWKSFNSLLKKINYELKKTNRYVNILVLNDSSTQRVNIICNNLKFIKKIKILTSTKNIGSQKIISMGLEYLKSKKNEIIVVMDSDGEDDVSYLNILIDQSIKRKNFVIVAKRIKRKENFIFQFLYNIHLMITFFLTMKWISFGNYSCFHSKNLGKILKNNLSWLAYSSCIMKNCNIYKVNAERQKRIFGKSKLTFFGLFKHSFRVLAVFQIKIILISILYIFLISFVEFNFPIEIKYSFVSILIIINFFIFISKKNTLEDYSRKKILLKRVENIK
tara:strand:- start:94 stop:957 length:864 start_codon:yes stop_codon:yes gene_type:complete